MNIFVRNGAVIATWWAIWLVLVYLEVHYGVTNFRQALYYTSIPVAFFGVWWANRGLFGNVEEQRRFWLVVAVSAGIWSLGLFLGIVIGVNFKFAIGGHI